MPELKRPVEPVAQERHTGPCAGWETRGHGVTTRPAEGRARMIAVAERRVEALHDEGRVVVAKRPARGDDAAGARGEEGARQAQRTLPGQQRPIRRDSQAGQHDQPAAEFPTARSRAAGAEPSSRSSPAVRNTAESFRERRIRSRVRSQMEDAERRERELLECVLRRRASFEHGALASRSSRWPIAFASCLAHGSGIEMQIAVRTPRVAAPDLRGTIARPSTGDGRDCRKRSHSVADGTRLISKRLAERRRARVNRERLERHAMQHAVRDDYEPFNLGGRPAGRPRQAESPP